YLIERYRPSERFLVLTIHTIDLPEVEINAKLDDLFGADPAVYIGLLAEHGKVDIRLTARGAGEQQLRERLEWFRKQIEGRIGTENIYGINDETLESAVGRLLKSRQLTIAVAESCTGGMIASRLTNMAGASSYLIEGFVTYSNNAKIERLGVSAELIERHGAVSRQVAQAMAESVRRLARADIGLSATGIAGPTGGTPEKAVGLVYVGLAWEGGSIAVERRFLGARNENRTYTTNAALDLLRRRLLRQTSASSDFGELSRAAKPSTQ
ncbi:nicotinamide-nucleotide amidohydrolase family protein, partial [Candidatus Sumerlaeota bacterium]|nr:nicotinamide-nucleotide amidohydrolase family protein [Candidatus Sumerlaeota bacterium]